MHIKAKKSLGQNFLVDQNIQQKIVDFCGITPSDAVLEIGPGQGQLTRRIVQAGARKLYAVELDRALAAELKHTFNGLRQVQIIQGDILKIDPGALAGDQKLKVVGNIPYYITSPIIEKMIKLHQRVSLMVFTVQKEFAERIAALPGSKAYGSFSCFVQYYAQARLLYTIPKQCFRPAPKVDSAVLSLTPRPWRGQLPLDEAWLFCVIRTAFNQRRKTLRNSLKDLVARTALDGFLAEHGKSDTVRAEELSLDDFIALANTSYHTSRSGPARM